ncbi:MAG: alpha/beta fold hydrolase, partial [Vicinamibacterales bacterium]
MYARWLLLALRTFFAALGAVSPRTAGRLALRVFSTPRRHHRPAWERQAAERGARLRVGSNLAAHAWGVGPVVLLAHGWEGRGTQLACFVDPLVAAGFRVVAVDSPAHGDSSGTRTDLIECTEALRKVARALGPLAGVVAHSFGGAVTTLALERGLDARSVVLIAMPSSIEDVVRRFGALIGLRGHALRAFRDGMERQTGVQMKDVEIFERVAGLTVPALIVHDRGDREVPFHDAERLSDRWPGATLVATDGLGHRRILKDEEVIRRAVSFIAQATPKVESSLTPMLGDLTQDRST